MRVYFYVIVVKLKKNCPAIFFLLSKYPVIYNHIWKLCSRVSKKCEIKKHAYQEAVVVFLILAAFCQIHFLLWAERTVSFCELHVHPTSQEPLTSGATRAENPLLVCQHRQGLPLARRINNNTTQQREERAHNAGANERISNPVYIST